MASHGPYVIPSQTSPPFGGGSVAWTKSSDLTTLQQSEMSDKTTFRRFNEQESTVNTKNVVVQKAAFDNALGVIYGPQEGSVDYTTGLIHFIPTDVARVASWGLKSGGEFTTDQSTAGSKSVDDTWAGTASYLSLNSVGGSGISGTTPSAGMSTKNGTTTESSSGGVSNANSGGWGTEAFSDEWGNGSLIRVTYTEASAVPVAETETLPTQYIELNLTPYTSQQIVPGSLMFTFAGATYVDRSGTLVMNPDFATGAGTIAGSVNYATGIATITFWVAGQAPVLTIISCLTRHGNWMTTSVAFRTAVSPVKPESVQVIATTINGEQLIATADANGIISSVSGKMLGKVNYETGIGLVAFGYYGPQPGYTGPAPTPTVWIAEPVDSSTIRYNAVAYSYLPLNATVLGLDPVRLPTDGRVPIFRAGGFAVVGNTNSVTQIVSNGTVIDCGRVRLSRVRVVGFDGVVINTGYTADLEAGTVTFADVTAYSQPVTVEHRIEDMAVVSDVQINGAITFTRPLTHNYPADTSYISSALVAGDLFGRVSLYFDQNTWDNVWSNTPGTTATGTFNNITYPITCTNRGVITERWVVRFTNSTAFEVMGENVGVIASGNISTDCAPINPNTGVPYFFIPALGWGGGWATGNVLRFNTIGAMFPVWVVRTVQQGPETVINDSFTLLIRGDVDTP